MNIEKLPELVEVNVGNWRVEAVYIIDNNFKIWASKGPIKGEVLNYYRKFPIAELEVGDVIHNRNSFLLKVTEKTGVIVVTPEPYYSLIAAANLKGRINALNELYKLDRLIKIIGKERR
ncbi:MAG: hypothetical protein ACTSWP_08025 [Candidatus Freyarchaeota archaeon]|nr:hypothetical protein [Candidatus Freyrarchaeum guaymaensis]